MKIINNSKLTLGMPVQNGEKYISYALNGIFKQNFKNFTLVICDNASTDKTLSICKKYQKKYNNIIIHKQNKRVSAIENWITTLKKSKSKFFLFCAHDDFFKEKEYLKNLVNKISSDTIPFGTVNIIDEKNNFIKHICNDKIYNYNGPSIYRRLKFFITPSIFGKNNIIYGIHERNLILKEMLSFKDTKDIKYESWVDNYINYKILKKKKFFPVINATLMKRIKNHEIKNNFFTTKRNKFRILLEEFNILLTYTKFSNFLEIIVIIILAPIYILYERLTSFFFYINNKI